MKFSLKKLPEGGLWQRSCAGLLLLCAAAVPTNAAFELVNDYEDNFGNTVWKQYGFGTDGIAEVVVDPVFPDSENNVLAIKDAVSPTNNVVAVTSIPVIADGTTGTVFFRFAVDESVSPVNGTLSVGPLAVAEGWAADAAMTPRGWGDNNAMLLLNIDGSLSGRTGATPTPIENRRGNLTWYKVWYVLNAGADTYSLYVQGGRFAMPTQLVENFAFRKDATGEDLQTLMFLAVSGSLSVPTRGTIYADDIYVDTAGENLTDPVPDAAPMPAVSDFALINDFSAGLGDLAWSQSQAFGTGSVEVIADPVPTFNVNNQVMAIQAGDTNSSSVIATLPIPQINDASQGTVFLRFAVDSSESKTDAAITISPLETPSGHGNANVLLVSNPSDQLRYRNGSAYETVVEARANLAWYKAWFVVDATGDRSSLYLQGPDLSTPTLVADDVAFRKDATGEDLMTLMFIAYAGNADAANLNGIVYVDDIYVDNQGANLNDPTDITLEERPNVGFLKTKASITVDGIKDASYTARGTPVERISYGISSPADLSATIYGTWNDAGLYLVFDVTDDVFSSVNAQGGSHRDDSIEIYFDPNLKRNGNLIKNDAKIVVHPKPDGSTEVWAAGFPYLSSTADFSGLQAAHVIREGGYVAEVFIPWAGLQIQPTGDWDLGMGIQLNDNDGVDLSDPADGIADKEGHLIWGIGDVAFNFNTQNYGVVTLWAPKKTVVARRTGAITVDGTREDAYNPSIVNYAGDRWTGAGAHPLDTDATWRTLYDDDNLYLFFEIRDSAIITDSPDAHRDDSLELFLDGNNSKGGNVDGYDDLKIVFHPQADGTLKVITAGFPSNPTGTDFSGLEAAHSITETGWNLEVKLPFSTMKLTPEAGAIFGIDIAVSDDDYADPVEVLNEQGQLVMQHLRDGVLTWSAGIGQNNRIDALGTAELFSTRSAVFAPVDEEVVVDGQIDVAYETAQWNVIGRTQQGERIPAASNISAVWAGVYDDEHIHIIVDVIDNNFSSDSPTALHRDDGIEFFFDPSNNGTGNFDGVEDVKISVVPQLDGSTVVVAATGQFPVAPAGTDFSGVEAAHVFTTLGWRVELKVPLVTLRLNGKAEAGWDLGFEVAVLDDDFGGVRDNAITWSCIGIPNFGTHQYGTVYLGGAVRLAFLIGATLSDEELGLYTSEWMGQFVEDHDMYGSWIYHAEMGWLYTGAVAPWDDYLWLYSPVIDAWIATDAGIFPAMSVDGAAWAHFETEGGSAWLYDYDTETWMAFE